MCQALLLYDKKLKNIYTMISCKIPYNNLAVALSPNLPTVCIVTLFIWNNAISIFFCLNLSFKMLTKYIKNNWLLI